MASHAIYKFDDFLEFLKAEYTSRSRKSAQYSQTQFAKEIGLTHSSLSEILNRRHGMSTATAKKVASALGLKRNEAAYFTDLVDMQHARAREARNMAAKRVRDRLAADFHPIPMNEFASVSDFYSFVIIEGLKLSQRINSSAGIRLPGMTEAATKDILENLKQQNLIEFHDGAWRSLVKRYRTPDEIPSEFGRKFHVGFLNKAMTALDKQGVPQREYQTCVLALPKNKIGAAKRRIKDFVVKFEREFSEGKQCDSVYALGMQFFNALQA